MSHTGIHRRVSRRILADVELILSSTSAGVYILLPALPSLGAEVIRSSSWCAILAFSLDSDYTYAEVQTHYGVFTAEHERVTLLAFLDKGG